MKYTIYKTTNLINDKIYIGCHKTDDPNDDYLGSGKHLKRSIEKYGIENFRKEVLFSFDNESEMFAKEKELVTEEFCKRKDTYNICPGGQGGWGYINRTGLNIATSKEERVKSLENARNILKEKLKNDSDFKMKRTEKYKETIRNKYEEGFVNPFYGKKHSNETKRKISEKNKQNTGNKNSMFNKVWLSDLNMKTNILVDKREIEQYSHCVYGKNVWLKNERLQKNENEEYIKSKLKEEKVLEEAKYWYRLFKKSNLSIRKFVESSDYNKSHVSFFNMIKKLNHLDI